MKERPILFSGPMVQAILDGHKTQTRRIQKEQHLGAASTVLCPYGQSGDRLWVKETWADVRGRGFDNDLFPVGVGYRAGCDSESLKIAKEYGVNWKPSIFMPRWASRITLEIVGVRVERLQDITPEDVAAEGIKKIYQGKELAGWLGPFNGHDFPYSHASEAYSALWDSINGNGAWAQNPWVWVISFKGI